MISRTRNYLEDTYSTLLPKTIELFIFEALGNIDLIRTNQLFQVEKMAQKFSC